MSPCMIEGKTLGHLVSSDLTRYSVSLKNKMGVDTVVCCACGAPLSIAEPSCIHECGRCGASFLLRRSNRETLASLEAPEREALESNASEKRKREMQYERAMRAEAVRWNQESSALMIIGSDGVTVPPSSDSHWCWLIAAVACLSVCGMIQNTGLLFAACAVFAALTVALFLRCRRERRYRAAELAHQTRLNAIQRRYMT